MTLDRNRSQLRIEVLGLESHLAKQVRELAVPACEALGLAEHLVALDIRADDLDGEDQAWFRFESIPSDDQGKLQLLLFCAAESFCRGVSSGLDPFMPREIWEQSEAPRQNQGDVQGEFAPKRAESFLYHNLLLAKDLIVGKLTPGAIPVGLVEAFQALWAVSVDGRLARAGLPHFNLGARRSRFSRLFSAVGVLLPDHWQLFQSLWDGGVSSQKEVLGVCRLLPRL